jgi:hypothetical protein
VRNRALTILLVAAVAGTAAGVAIARLSREAEPGQDVIGLGRQATVDGEAGSLTIAAPDDWFVGSTEVNCETTDDVHASTDQVELVSFKRTIGTGGTCAAELDPRPLPSDGAYVTAAFFQIAEVGCGTSLPTAPPASLGAMELGTPPEATLGEFKARGAYDPFEWRIATWCVGGGFAVRLEVFVGEDADQAARDEVGVIVRALAFEPAG